ncbi:CRISPR-associated helicase Cas3' [Thorsellia anophelis]|nr:CRISPR-associated helicase Cas3' [Thorsellia anophelis]
MLNRKPNNTQNSLLTDNIISFKDCPAKTYIDKQGKTQFGYNVFEHCLIVGEIAKALIRRFPAQLASNLFPQGSALMASLHDIGKVSPSFYLKLYKAVDINLLPKDFNISNVIPDESSWGGHAGVSALTLEKICDDSVISIIAGQHHGFTPNTGMLNANSKCLGGETWQAQRELLVNALKEALVEDFPIVKDHYQALFLSGLTSVADWIGSGDHFEAPNLSWKSNIEKALDQAGFIFPLIRKDLSFGDIFKDQDGNPFTPNHAQETLSIECKEPGLYILEAPMGLGKTEAALFAAYKILESGKSNGIYFALPTQLTSNKVYDRFNEFLSAIVSVDSPNNNSLLLHSNASLLDVSFGEEGRPGNSWFNSNKRGLLAPFAVGTIDQALMASMNVKHGFVRAFGLAGKVVILDEVHSYDSYTGTLLDELISLLRNLHCTVIILSATLTQFRRTKFLESKTSSHSYPLISISHNSNPKNILEYPLPSLSHQRIKIDFKSMDHKLLINDILTRAEQGEHILWIENTVHEAQQLYMEFATHCKELSIDCGLLHSRFTQHDRQINEDYWVELFGKNGWNNRTKSGRILIGTQVLEQSLDIDADLLVTRFAPCDMLFQRLGRLWRHRNTPRPKNALCQAWILSPTYQEALCDPYSAFGPTSSVYAPYILCRSLLAWSEHLKTGVVTLPSDIRLLLELTYSERPELGVMETLRNELINGNRNRKGLNTLQQLAKMNIARGGKTLSDVKVQTRYSIQNTGQILIVKHLNFNSDKKITEIGFTDGSRINIPWQKHMIANFEWRKLSVHLAKHIVNCPYNRMPESLSKDWCKKVGLGNVHYLGEKEADETNFAIGILSSTFELKSIDNHSNLINNNYKYTYRKDIGLRIHKIEK